MDNKEENEVAFVSDIAKDLAKELNQSYRFAMYHIVFLRDWLYHLTLNPKIHCIKLYSLGRMYRSLPVSKNILRKLVRSGNRYKTTSERRDRVSEAIEDLERKVEDYHNEEPTRFNVHRAKSRINKSFHTLSRSKRELEEFQNKEDE